jgi:flagellar biosynthesis chaperone FliJ
LHSRAVSAFADKSVDLEKRLQQECRRAESAESELKVVRDHCRSLEGQLKSSSDSVVTLQSQLSQAEADVRLCKHAMQLDDDRCNELEAKLRQLSHDHEVYVQEITEQVEAQMNVQDGFVSYIQALGSSGNSAPNQDSAYLGSNVVPCSDRDLFEMDEALKRLLKDEKQAKPISAAARIIWLQLCGGSTPGTAELRVCVKWLMQHDISGALGLPVFQRPVVDLALAALSVRLNFQDFVMLAAGCVAASHSLSRFLSVSGPSLVISRAQFKQNVRWFGLKRLNTDASCDEAFDSIDCSGSGIISFRQFDEWYEREKCSDIVASLASNVSGEFLKL